jgi:uncharacterized repeat protein (TIGR01451 family)
VSKPSANGTTIDITWTIPSTTNTFILTRSFNSGGDSTVQSGIASSTTTYQQTGLADGTYVYKIYAVDGVGNISNAGTSSMIIIDSTALSAPSGFAASASADSINLSWTNPVSDFDSVSIRRSSSGYPSTVAEGESVTSGSTGNSYSNTSLSVGTYYYSIFAYDSYGNISAAAHATATITPPELNIVVTAPSFENIALNDNLQFQVTVSNETSQNSENAEVTFTLSENLEFVSAEITLIEAVTASSLDPKSNRRISKASTAICSGSDTIVCNIGTVNAGQTVSLSVTTRVTAAGAISLAEWTAIAQKITGKTLQITSDLSEAKVDIPYYVSDSSLAMREFSWKPQKQPQQIAEDIYQWLKAEEKMLKPIFG